MTVFKCEHELYRDSFVTSYLPEIDECVTTANPCNSNGDCLDMVNSFECMCYSGWTGDRCQIGKLS